MKSILLAAAAMIAAPAMAQDQTTPPADQSAPAPADQSMTPPADPAAPAAPDATQTPPTASAPAAPMAGATQTTGATPDQAAQQGGYQPAGPAVSGTPAPGAPVKFQPAADPNTAYPPPAPKDSYPICKKGQYDGCTQASDVHRSGKAHAKKRRK